MPGCRSVLPKPAPTPEPLLGNDDIFDTRADTHIPASSRLRKHQRKLFMDIIGRGGSTYWGEAAQLALPEGHQPPQKR
jgi:hypothetical protein